MTELTETLIADLESIDTPTVCNALELVVPERRGYGFTTQPLVCTRPELGSMVAVARTAQIRSAHPSHLRGEAARAMNDGYYAYIDEGPKPAVVVTTSHGMTGPLDKPDEMKAKMAKFVVVDAVADGFEAELVS